MNHIRAKMIAAGFVNILLLLCVSGALAAGPNDLELWFSTNPNVASIPVLENPVLPVGYVGKVYLYARTHGSWQTVSTTYVDDQGVTQPWQYTDWVGAVWESLSLGANTTIGFAGSVLNPAAAGVLRWETQSDFTWANGDQFAVIARYQPFRGIGGAAPPPPGAPGLGTFDDQQATSGPYLYTKVAEMTISSAPAHASFFLTVGTSPWSICRRCGDPTNDLVFFGVGDAGVHGPVVGATSTLADMTVAPEPTGVLMLLLASVGLRRR